MKPRRTHTSNKVFRLVGGTEDNDLWVERAADVDGAMILISTWVPTFEERERIYNGENIALVVWGSGMPPVHVTLTDVAVGKAPDE